MEEFPVAAVVAQLEERTDLGLRKGQVGTVVFELGPDTLEVEFADERGHTYALAALPVSQLLRLHHSPGEAA